MKKLLNQHTHYFKNLEENPLTNVKIGDTTIKVQATGQTQINGKNRGFLAGKQTKKPDLRNGIFSKNPL